MLLVWIFILINLTFIFGQYGVTLSADRDDFGIYEGYLWTNNNIVFLSPELKASIVKGISKSEKICGFELRSNTIKDIPFMVSLLDELSGVGEMRIKPHKYVDYQSQPTFDFTVEAFDCDSLPHYSKGITVKIHIINESGPTFDQESYTFSVKKDSNVGSVVGNVRAKSSKNNNIEFYIQQNQNLPFEINELGTIFTRQTLKNITQSSIQIRVVAKEKSKGIAKQSMVLVTIEIKPVCKTRLTGVPDQLDYYMKKEYSNMMDAGQLIQQGQKPLLNLCPLPSPLKEATLKISLASQSSSVMDAVSTKQVCQKDVSSAYLQRLICGAQRNTIGLVFNEEGFPIINGNNSLPSAVIKNFGSNFTLTWWMKRNSNEKTDIFCLQEDLKSLTISVENCNLIINEPEEELKIKIQATKCHLNKWIFYAITQQEESLSILNVWVDGSLTTRITTKSNLFQFKNLKLFNGRCSSQMSQRHTRLSGHKSNPLIEMGVLSMTVEDTLKEDAIGCLSTCGEAVVINPISSKISVERRGTSLFLKSTSILQLLESLSKIHYINTFFLSKGDDIKVFDMTDVWIDLLVECESKEIITVPRAVMRINFIQTQKDLATDINEVEIISNQTISVSKSQSIHIFPNLRFIYGNSENSVVENVKIESCTIRLLQRSLVPNERIYLPYSWTPILDQYKLEVKSTLLSWSIEGEADSIIYENILRQVLLDMIDERKRFSVICILKGGDFTNQAIVEVIKLKPHHVHYTIDESSQENVHHKSINERSFFQEKNRENTQNLLNISKSKFVGVIIMAVVGGAAWALVTAAITCFVLRRRESSKDRKKNNISKNYSKTNECNINPPSLVNNRDVFIDYEYEEDRTSMADIPDDEEQNLDNISCETCNMTDPDVMISLPKPVKDIPRSRTITFPIIHRKF